MLNLDDFRDWFILIIVGLAIIPLGHFVYRYHRFSPWRATREGKNMMGQKIAMLAVFLIIFVARLFGDWPGRTFVTVLVYLVLLFFFYNTDRQLIRVQKSHPPRDNWKSYWANRKRNTSRKGQVNGIPK